MKAHILNRKRINELFDHILDGFDRSEQGIELAYKAGVLNKEEYINLLKLNAERLITRVRDFKIINRIISLFFASYFTLMQVQGTDLEMRRSTRTRTSARSSRSNGRRRNDIDINDCYHQRS